MNTTGVDQIEKLNAVDESNAMAANGASNDAMAQSAVTPADGTPDSEGNPTSSQEGNAAAQDGQ
ncbi:MAG TPA: hypothetical protein VMU37_00650 [Caulobacteraceae bacterium]|nr:hypothetical protein [Caulobacteraceae bacterium]